MNIKNKKMDEKNNIVEDFKKLNINESKQKTDNQNIRKQNMREQNIKEKNTIYNVKYNDIKWLTGC